MDKDPESDPLLELWGMGKEIWADTTADKYVAELRGGLGPSESAQPQETPGLAKLRELTFDKDRLFRSHVLYETIALESLLDRIIASYFCPDEGKHGLFYVALFQDGQIGLRTKIRVLERIARASCPDLRPSVGFICKRLNRLRDLRNKFAHSQIVVPDDFPTTSLPDGVSRRILDTSGKETHVFVSTDTINRQLAECKALSVALLILDVITPNIAAGVAADAEVSVFLKVVAKAEREYKGS